MAKKKRKKITLSREFYERHEWIQRNIAARARRAQAAGRATL